MKAIYTNLGPILTKTPSLWNLFTRGALRGGSQMLLIQTSQLIKQGLQQNQGLKAIIANIITNAPSTFASGGIFGAGVEGLNLMTGNNNLINASNFSKNRSKFVSDVTDLWNQSLVINNANIPEVGGVPEISSGIPATPAYQPAYAFNFGINRAGYMNLGEDVFQMSPADYIAKAKNKLIQVFQKEPPVTQRGITGSKEIIANYIALKKEFIKDPDAFINKYAPQPQLPAPVAPQQITAPVPQPAPVPQQSIITQPKTTAQIEELIAQHPVLRHQRT